MFTFVIWILILDPWQASGLDFLHKNGIIHWDLRAHNIIINQAGYCKIGNFERAIHMPYGYSMAGREKIDNLSPHTAPELLWNSGPGEVYRFDHAVDMWALGMIVCELQVGKVGVGV